MNRTNYEASVIQSVQQLIRSSGALILREMSTTYGRSPGGYLWAVLEPVAGIALITFAFSLAFRNPPIGSSFALFYATGLLVFLMYSDVATKIQESIRFSKQLLFYPRVTFVDAVFARFLLNFTTQILIFSLVIFGTIILLRIDAILRIPAIVSSIAMVAVLCLGVGTLNCFLVSAFPIWSRVWAIMNRPLFIVSCVFFIPENLPEPYRSIVLYNPLVHAVGQMRSGFYPGYEASYVSVPYVFGISIVSLCLGLVFLKRYNREILNR